MGLPLYSLIETAKTTLLILRIICIRFLRGCHNWMKTTGSVWKGFFLGISEITPVRDEISAYEYPTVNVATQVRTGEQILSELDDYVCKLQKFIKMLSEMYEIRFNHQTGHKWSDVIILARQFATSRRGALLSIRELSNLLGKYSDY